MNDLKLRDYILPSWDFTCAGAGTARWTYGRNTKDNREVFIKEFLSPVYPPDTLDLPQSIRFNRINQCRAFYINKKQLYSKIGEVNKGNHVVPFDFFKFKNKFYSVSEKIDGITMNAETIISLPLRTRRVLIQSIAYSMMQLETAGVVHSDLKPDNIILKNTFENHYSIKLIDYDASYFASNPPTPGLLQGDLVYLSPEMLLYMNEEDVKLTSKSDVFSFGILMHEILCGQVPSFDKEFFYLHEVSLNGGKVNLNRNVPIEYWPIIISCLSIEPDDRPSFSDLFRKISAIHEELINKTPSESVFIKIPQSRVETLETPNVIIYMGSRKKES